MLGQGAGVQLVRSGQILDDLLKHKLFLFSNTDGEAVSLMEAAVWHEAQLKQNCAHASCV